MIREALHTGTKFVSNHNRITLLVMILLSAAVVAGIPQLDTGSQAGADPESFENLDRVQAMEYVDTNYSRESRENVTVQTVYVWREGGNALSKASLLEGLYYQQNVTANKSVATALHGNGMVGIENLVAHRAAGDPSATLEAQITALETTPESAVETLVAKTLADDPRASQFLPADHASDQPTVTDRRVLVMIDGDAPEDTRTAALAALYGQADQRSANGFFTFTDQAVTEWNQHFFNQMTQLVVPVALGLILFVLAFAYRDLVDIVVGMTGVVLSVAWMFGIMGWIGVAAGTMSIIPVVLITGLSIDFGFHVFNRYREQRGPEDGIRDSMRRGTVLVATALVLVTVTAAISFLANLANPLPVIRNLGVSITMGVVSSFVIFLTVVPALKISIDGMLEGFGIDRHKLALGRGTYLAPVLRSTVTLARRAAPVVLVVAVLAGAAGGAAWTDLDREEFDNGADSVADWKQNIPGPLGWERHELGERNAHVQDRYQPATEDDADRSRILVEGDVTHEETLEDLHAGVAEIRSEDDSLLVETAETPSVRSPVTAMRAVAAENESFAAALEAADSDGNGIPDSDLESLYDAFYAADASAASQVVEQREGEYRSVLVTLLLDSDWTERQQTVATLEDGRDEMTGSDRSATLAGGTAIQVAALDKVIGGVLLTMGVALLTVVVVLSLAFRGMHGSATLGAVVALPIALVVALVIGAMSLLDMPLNLLSALLMSLVIGLGVDYNIHIGDRFADELRAGRPPGEALEVAVTGTGGALLGSTLTSVGAFTTLVLVPSGQIQGFGTLVVIALLTAFVVSVVVMPSALLLWSRYSPSDLSTTTPTRTVLPQD
jgi:predicted RND superfamily exporter protein